MGPKAFDAAVVVIPDIPERLAGLRGNFVEAISFEEVEFQRLNLFRRKLVPKLLQEGSPGEFINRYLPPMGLQAVLIELLTVVVLSKA